MRNITYLIHREVVECVSSIYKDFLFGLLFRRIHGQSKPSFLHHQVDVIPLTLVTVPSFLAIYVVGISKYLNRSIAYHYSLFANPI